MVPPSSNSLLALLSTLVPALFPACVTSFSLLLLGCAAGFDLNPSTTHITQIHNQGLWAVPFLLPHTFHCLHLPCNRHALHSCAISALSSQNRSPPADRTCTPHRPHFQTRLSPLSCPLTPLMLLHWRTLPDASRLADHYNNSPHCPPDFLAPQMCCAGNSPAAPFKLRGRAHLLLI